MRLGFPDGPMGNGNYQQVRASHHASLARRPELRQTPVELRVAQRVQAKLHRPAVGKLLVGRCHLHLPHEREAALHALPSQ